MKLFEELIRLYPDSSKRTLKIWLKNGRVLVDGKVEKFPQKILTEKSVITLQKVQENPIPEFSILYEDEHIVIIDKPAGLLSVPLDKERSKNALQILRKHYGFTIYAVHRIDRDTSGVLAFAKTEEAREGMDALFQAHDLTREYIALLEGAFATEKGTWESFLIEKTHFEVCSAKTGKKAITHFEVMKQTGEHTLVKLYLETGRKHQIRVHCFDAGHSIVGDKRYGSKTNPFKRLCLHANKLSFIHPITSKKISAIANKPSFIRGIS